MKFAKYLQEEVVPEWRKAYINYKQGKKHLKAIERVLDELDLKAAQALEEHEAREALQDTLSPLPTLVQQQQQQPSNPSSTKASKSESTASTPIMSRRRGSGRNYSSINFLPPLALSASTTSPRRQGETPTTTVTVVEEENRSAFGGRTLNGDEHDGDGDDEEAATARTVQPKEVDGLRQSLGSTAFQFGQTARSQSTQLLKNLSRRFTIIGPSEIPVRVRSIQIDDNSIDNILDQLLPEEQVFFQFLDSQLELVNNFYQEKELEAVTKLKVIQQQLFVASQWKRRYDDHMARAKAEHGWYAAEWSRVRKGFDNLIRVDTAVTEDVTLNSKKSGFTPVGTFTGGVGAKLDAERMLRHRDLRGLDSPNGASVGVAGNHKISLDALAYQEELELQEEEDRRQYLNHKVARTRIKAALYEFYRSLEMIKNYKVLNHTGFAKILKKFDKTAGWKGSKPYMNSRLKPAYFMTSVVIEDLIKETEDLFIETFEKGHRRRGMAKLRIPDSKNQTHHFTATRIGMYMGLAAPLLFQALQAAFSSEMPEEIPYWDGLLLVYAGLFLTFLFACLFGINMYVWAKARINYKFIFEFDPRDNLDYHEYFELPILLILLLTLAVYLDFGSKLTQHVATAYWPLILMSITVAIIFCPLPIAHFTARRWFISSIGRILASGYYRVEFRDFFLADEMNSLSYSIEQFEFAMCAYSEQWSDLSWFRFLQCLRRYRDTLEWFPHLVNAGKYSASLINLFVYFSFRHYGGAHLKTAWIFVSVLTSCYTFGWDVYMDWGLFRFGKNGGGAHGHPFLRPELVYSRTWVYYMAIVLDFLGRFSWTARLISMNINVMVLSFILAFLEVLRRWQWNFFRLENEHLNNCGQFRAIKDIPLPFHIRVQGESDDEEDEDDDNNSNNLNHHSHYNSSNNNIISDALHYHQDRSGSHPDLHRQDLQYHVHQEGVFHLQEDQDEDSADRGSTFPHLSMASSSRKSGLVRSSSSQSSLFGALSNGSHAHGLSNLSSNAGVGVGVGIGTGGGGEDEERGGGREGGERGVQPPKLRTSKSRTSFHSATSFSQPRRPYGAMAQRSFSHGSTAQGIAATGGGGEMNSLTGIPAAHLSRTSLHDTATATATAGVGASNTSLHHPFSTSRSNSFVDNAVAEAGFTGVQREILEAELTNSNKKFYDRRDFDSKIIEVENSSSDLWQRRQPRKEKSMTGLNSLHGLQALSSGGAIGGGGQGGLEERVHDFERRAKSQAVQPRRKMSMGTRMRNSIFGRRGQSSDSEDDEEADTE
ncbi:hypothetical protein BGZ95_005832 [Linnemannia exigua]|uniref:Uncharacterized protein n=1 Tax=Linnemannia exigua TaxID=604196 RepID=A0AAD4DLD7_9FUNG|nr:hypothetical protein BGZ95_005832 [Linnemannia exigua]